MGKIKDITGQRFGSLTAISRTGEKKHGHMLWLCKCDCGEEKIVSGKSLRLGFIKSCDCIQRKARIEKITSVKYGRLKAIKEVGKDKRGEAYWLCQCDCGNKKAIRIGSLRSGLTKSCGCLSIEENIKRSTKHGYSSSEKRSPTYESWCNFKSRCFNKNNPSYKNYGGRGITVCERWLEFKNFLADMGECPKGLTIERINNDGNYELSNCKWVTRKVQNNNRRDNVIIEYKGQKLTIAQWAMQLKINYGTLLYRIKRYPPEIAFNMTNTDINLGLSNKPQEVD